MKIDVQDVLLMLGMVLFLGGIAHFSPAIAAIAGGLLCFGLVVLIDRARELEQKRGVDGSAHK